MINMIPHVQNLIEEFPEDLSEQDVEENLASENLFKIDGDSPELVNKKVKKFHTCVYKGLFFAKEQDQIFIQEWQR